MGANDVIILRTLEQKKQAEVRNNAVKNDSDDDFDGDYLII